MRTLVVENKSNVKVMFYLTDVASIKSKGKYIIIELVDGVEAEFLRQDVTLYFE